MKQDICFFIGHRECGRELYPALCAAVERHIVEEGAAEFWVGDHGGFDRLAVRALQAAKQSHPGIKLFLLLAWHPSRRAVELPKGFDGSVYPPGMERVPPRAAIPRANRYAVDNARWLIAAVWRPASCARELVEYALRRRDGPRVTVLPARRA